MRTPQGGGALTEELGALDPLPSAPGRHLEYTARRATITILICSALVSFVVTAGLVALYGLPLIWSVPVYGAIGALTAIVLGGVVYIISSDGSDDR